LAGKFSASTCGELQIVSIFHICLPSQPACQRFLFDLASIRVRSVTSSQIAIRRTTIHLLVRLAVALAVAATCTSAAAAFDTTHISGVTGLIVSRSHSLEHRRHESRPNHSQSLSVAVDAPSSLMAGRGSLAKSQSALQPEVGVQQGELEELGKQ
jgi:hypothetical protein